MSRFLPGLTAGVLCAAVGLHVSSAAASERETFAIGGNTVTVHAYDFLTAQELDTLRLVGTDPEALALFMGDGPGHGAIAIAPEQGFIRDGMPAPGVAALAQLPHPQAARNAAIAMCEQERSGGPACVVVLELAPN